MGVSYHRDQDLIILDCREPFQLPEARAVLGAAIAETSPTPPPKLLIYDPDSQFRPTADEIPSMAQSLAKWLPKIHPAVALVVEREVKFGIGRMIGIHCEEYGLDFQVFRDLDQAKQWLRRKVNSSEMGA